jgi:hypothetical protein
MDELIATLSEALVAQKERIDDLQSTLDLLQDETLANQSEIVKVREQLQKQIEDTILTTQKMIDKTLKSITIEPERVDYNRIFASVQARINRLNLEKTKDISEVKTDLTIYIRQQLSKYKPKDGTDGEDADSQLIIQELKKYISDNKQNFRGVKGVDGVGIDNIQRIKDEIVITLTNGSIKKFKLPKDTNITYGGGGASYFEEDETNHYLYPKDLNNSLGIGTRTPDTRLHFVGDGTKEKENKKTVLSSINKNEVIISDTVVANTIAETEIYKAFIPANYLSQSDVVETIVNGIYSTANSSDTFTVNVILDGVTVHSFTSVPKKVTSTPVELLHRFTVRSVGETASIQSRSNFAAPNQSLFGGSEENITLDTTKPCDLSITMQWNTALPTNSGTIKQGFTKFF